MSRLSLSAALAAIALVAAPAASFAQTGAAAPTPAAPATMPAASAPAAMPASAAPGMPKDVSARVEQHIKQLHDQLGVTAAEEPQWTQFAQVMRDNAAQMGQAFADRESKASGSAVDNMQSYAAVAQTHATNMQKLASAFQALYNSFPDAQKQKADAVFRSTGGRPPAAARPHR